MTYGFGRPGLRGGGPGRATEAIPAAGPPPTASDGTLTPSGPVLTHR